VPIKMKLFLLFIAAIIITLSACGKESDDMQSAASEYQFSDYQKLSIIIPDDITAKDFMLTETGILLLTNSGIININYSGEMDEEIPLAGSETFAYFSVEGDDIFNILTINQSEDGTVSLVVNRFKSDGTGIGFVVLKSPSAEETDNPYPVNFLTVDGYHYIQLMYSLYVYDAAGELVQTVREEHDTFAKSLFLTEDGKAVSVSTRNRNNMSHLVVRAFESDASDFEEHIISIVSFSPGIVLTCGGGLGLLFIEGSGLYEYRLETGRGNLVLNLLDHGVNTGEVLGLSLAPGGDIICVLPRDSILARTAGEVVVFSKRPDHIRGTMEAHRPGEGTPAITVDMGPPKEKETITMAVIDPSTRIKERVALFNKINLDYTIEVINYLDGRDEIDARRQFIIDLAHSPADIIVLQSYGNQSIVPIQSYNRKGIFTDLYEIMDADPEFNRADYLPNIFTALEMDGRLYTIFPEFCIRVIVGKASDLGNGTIGWTLDEFMSFLDTKPGAKFIIGEWTKEDFIKNMVEFYFTDPETGWIKFDRDAFLKILEIAARFPKTSYPIESLADYHDFYFGLKDGNPLMDQTVIIGGGFGARHQKISEYINFGEDINYKGFPSSAGSGTYFHPTMRLAISEKSSKKNGAWEFIKFTMNVYEDSSWWSNMYLPIKISELEADLAATLINPLYGTENEYVFYVEIDGNRVTVGNNTPELNAKIMEVITTTTVVAPNDTVVREIIAEEVAFYLAGQKSPDQVADVIENRVGIYLSELE